MWTTIKLPRSQRPIFPDRCVACGAEHPGEASFVPYSLPPIPGLFNLSGLIAVKAPKCNRCRRTDRKKAALLFPVCLVSLASTVLIALTLLTYVLKLAAVVDVVHLPQWVLIPLLLTIACAIVLPTWMLVRWLRPQAIEIGPSSGGEVVFRFRDAQYARDFEALNARAGDVSRQALTE